LAKALFGVVHIFVVMEIGSRRIVHANVTTNPTLSRLKQQIREATVDDHTPSSGFLAQPHLPRSSAPCRTR